MNIFSNKRHAGCSDVQTQLEAAANLAPSAKQLAELFGAAPAVVQAHAASCEACREYANGILQSRSVLGALPSNAGLAGPWFAPRVMAMIAARRAELARVPDTWSLLPKLAARLTWASAVALLLASGWLYQRPTVNNTQTSAKAAVTDITGEPVHDTSMPSNNDEVLVSLAERPQ